MLLLEPAQRILYAPACAVPRGVQTQRVMYLRHAVKRHAYEKMLLDEKVYHLVRERVAVRLYGVAYAHAARVVHTLKLDQTLEKIKPGQSRLPALKGKGDMPVGVAQRAADKIIQRFFVHAAHGSKLAPRSYVTVKTVAAAHITAG